MIEEIEEEIDLSSGDERKEQEGFTFTFLQTLYEVIYHDFL